MTSKNTGIEDPCGLPAFAREDPRWKQHTEQFFWHICGKTGGTTAPQGGSFQDCLYIFERWPRTRSHQKSPKSVLGASSAGVMTGLFYFSSPEIRRKWKSTNCWCKVPSTLSVIEMLSWLQSGWQELTFIETTELHQSFACRHHDVSTSPKSGEGPRDFRETRLVNYLSTSPGLLVVGDSAMVFRPDE